MIGPLRIRGNVAPTPPSPGDVLAAAENISVQFGSKPILTDVDVEVCAGEVLALVGPNGAGKSTLLSALAADVACARGRVMVSGRAASAWSAQELAMRRAVLPQATTLAFPFTVAEVVEMGRAPWAHTAASEEDAVAVAEALAECELADYVDRPFSALSGGERARVSLARVLAQRTDLMMLDEPTAALDLRHQEMTLRACRDRAAAGAAVVVVLHDLTLAAAYCDRTALLDQGGLAAIGEPAEVFDADVLTQVYRQDVEVWPHPVTGDLVILPRREHARTGRYPGTTI